MIFGESSLEVSVPMIEKRKSYCIKLSLHACDEIFYRGLLCWKRQKSGHQKGFQLGCLWSCRIGSGAVLEILLSSFQTACCCGLCIARMEGSSRRVSVMLRHKFCEGLQFSFMATKKRSSLDFLSFDSKRKPVTLLFSMLCMLCETL